MAFFDFLAGGAGNAVADPRFVDPYGVGFGTSAATPQQGGIFGNPNFQNLLAGIGASLDPEGFGGALGRATQQYVQSQAAQKAVGEQEKQRQLYNARLISLLGGLTPKGQPGLTSVETKEDGSTVLKHDPPSALTPGAPNPSEGQKMSMSSNPSMYAGSRFSDAILPF